MTARCGSCGVPVRDENAGTESDGSASEAFCKSCYAGGSFTQPDASIEEVRETAMATIIAEGVPPLIAKRLTENMAEMSRWA